MVATFYDAIVGKWRLEGNQEQICFVCTFFVYDCHTWRHMEGFCIINNNQLTLIVAAAKCEMGYWE